MPRRTEPDALAEAIGRRIRELREDAGLTLEKLAFESALGSKGHLSDIEKGRVRPTVHTLKVLADRLGVELLDLVTFPGSGQRHQLVDATRSATRAQCEALMVRLDALRPRAARPTPPRGAAGARGRGRESPPPFRVTNPRPEARHHTCVPLVDLAVAAGGFDARRSSPRVTWVVPQTRRRLRAGMFVARVTGTSMEPLIPDGAWCLFRGPVSGKLDGRILLVQHGGIHDSDSGAAWTVKRYEATKSGTRAAPGTVRLVPINRAHRAIEIHAAMAPDLRVVAEFVEVIGADAAP